jgi:hypothetical protein
MFGLYSIRRSFVFFLQPDCYPPFFSSVMFRTQRFIGRRLLTTLSSHAAPSPPPHGLIPPMLDGQVHVLRTLAQLRSKTSDIEKNIFLSQLKGTDENLFYKITLGNMSEITPLI